MPFKIKSISTIEFISGCKTRSLFGSFDKVSILELQGPILHQVFKKSLMHGQDEKISVHFSSSITKDWIDNKFLNFDLFAEKEVLLIYNCESLNKDLFEYLYDVALSGDFKVILIFNKDTQKKYKGEYLKIKKNAFWESTKVFESLVDFYELEIPQQSRYKIGSYLESDHEQVFSLINSLQSFQNGEISEELIEKILPSLSLNQFDLVDYLNRKEIREFFVSLSKLRTFEELSRSVSFSISHLIKIASPPDNGANLNNYNQKILKASKIWSDKELSAIVGGLKDILVLSRLKNKKAFIKLMKASISI